MSILSAASVTFNARQYFKTSFRLDPPNQRCGGLGLFSQNLTHINFGEHLWAFTALQNFEAILIFDPKNQICHGLSLNE